VFDNSVRACVRACVWDATYCLMWMLKAVKVYSKWFGRARRSLDYMWMNSFGSPRVEWLVYHFAFVHSQTRIIKSEQENEFGQAIRQGNKKKTRASFNAAYIGILSFLGCAMSMD